MRGGEGQRVEGGAWWFGAAGALGRHALGGALRARRPRRRGLVSWRGRHADLPNTPLPLRPSPKQPPPPGAFPANRYAQYMTSATSVAISLKHREMVILGTEYAGEMKKGVFRWGGLKGAAF